MYTIVNMRTKSIVNVVFTTVKKAKEYADKMNDKMFDGQCVYCPKIFNRRAK